MADARHRLLAFGNSAAFAMVEPPALMIGRSGRHGRVFGLVPIPRLGEQARRRRMIPEQRHMRRDIFRAPKSCPSAHGKSSGPIPSEPATARMSTAPSLESRVGPLASSAFCAPASSPSLNFCAATPRQRRTAQSFASRPCSRLIQNRATSAATGFQAAPRLSVRAIPGHIQTPPARASSGCAGAATRALPETRTCMQKSQRGEIRRSAYSGSATKPALVRVIGLFAEASISGARPSAARASLMVKMPFDV